jgi:hypothetical protein
MHTGTPSRLRRFNNRIAGWLESGGVGRRSPRFIAAFIIPAHPSRSYFNAMCTTYLPNASSRTCAAGDRRGVATGWGGVARFRFVAGGSGMATSGRWVSWRGVVDQYGVLNCLGGCHEVTPTYHPV